VHRRILIWLVVGASTGAGAAPRRGVDATDVARARASTHGQHPSFTWESWGPDAFARARREHKPLLLDGAAAWCHWCHVMDETTYADPAVAELLRDKFVPVRFDVDAHPDLAERYGAWGWPATVLLSAGAEEVGKYRGYLPPAELLGILRNLDGLAPLSTRTSFDDAAAPVDALGYVAAFAIHAMDGYYDEEQGGWGMRRKAPLSANAEFELRRAAHGDARGLRRATVSLTGQRALIDPVWGGIYQYSAASDWKSPHFEKLMTYQAPAIEALARAYQATHDAALLDDARRIASYMLRVLRSPEGTFYVSQDADVGAHDPAARFVDGHVFYAKGDAGRRALGQPWVDTHVYAYENGLAISALCALFEAAREPADLEAARRAADALIASHLSPDGRVRREAGAKGPTLLADAASLGRALIQVGQLTGEPRYLDAATRIGKTVLADLRDPASGAFWEHSTDADAAGVFARRDHPFSHNVTVALFFTELARATGDDSWARTAREALAAVSTPAALEDAGPWLGELLLALDDAHAVRWP
jgi:uncharacterized protein YyaL (SSP411 family)